MSRRRLARRLPSPLPQRHGLDAVRVVPSADEAGRSVRDVLTARFPALVSAEAQDLGERFARGDVVDRSGAPYRPTDAVTRASEIFFHREIAPEPVDEVDIPVVFEDEHLLVVDKPAGVASIPRGEHVLRSALVRLRVRHGIQELSPLHRLDKQTAGLLALSKVRAERGAYQQMFAEAGRVTKRYRAVCWDAGAHGPARERLLAGEAVDVREAIRKDHGDIWAHSDAGGRAAHSTMRLVDRWESAAPGAGEGGAARFLLDLVPHTGRTHQLRLHCTHVGLPILGDELYPQPAPDPVTGQRQRRDTGGIDLQLQAVHLAFTDPLTGEERSFTTPTRLTEAPR